MYLVALAVVTLGLGAIVAWATILWVRTGRRRPIVIADASTWTMAWTLMLPLVFLNDNVMLVAWVLAPACLLLVAVVHRPHLA